MRGNWEVSDNLDLKANEELSSESLLQALAVPRCCPVTPLSVFSVIVGVCVYLQIPRPPACISDASLELETLISFSPELRQVILVSYLEILCRRLLMCETGREDAGASCRIVRM